MQISCAYNVMTRPIAASRRTIISRYRSIEEVKPLISKDQGLRKDRHYEGSIMTTQPDTYISKPKSSSTKSHKLPALQFYPGDWWRDLSVKLLDHYHKGIWFELLLLMHDSEERGCLTINGRPMSDDEIGLIIGLVNQKDNQIATKAIERLLDVGVASRRDDGALVCRRMVREEEIRSKRIKCGSMGGNPILLNQKANQRDNQITEDEYEVEDEDIDNKKENSIALDPEIPEDDKKIKSQQYPKLYFSKNERDKLLAFFKEHDLEAEDLTFGLQMLQTYAENNPKKFGKYKSHYMVMRGWVFDKVLDRKKRMLDLERSELYAERARA